METRILTRADVAQLLTLDACIDVVERAFARHARGQSLSPGVLGIPSVDGGFHIKAAGLMLARQYFAAKVNANFPLNPDRFGLPTIQGVIVLCDAQRGSPLAVMDSIEITALRTAAATAVAARYLANADSRELAVCGCGTQGRVQARALARVLPLERITAFDVDPARAAAFAAEMAPALSCRVDAVDSAPAAISKVRAIVTCTTSTDPFVMSGDVQPGSFIAAVGADNERKHEIDPALMARSVVIVDSLDQCATIGDLHHAIVSGAMTRESVRAHLGEVIAGRAVGRRSDDEVVIFDSTGVAIQDVAAAALVYEAACARDLGIPVDLGG